jgi:hypothetical protein
MPIFGVTASSNMTTKLTDFYQIATTTLGSAQSSVEFTSIPADYTHLQIRGILRSSSVDAVKIQFNSDTGSNYSYHYLWGNGGSVGSSAGTSTSSGAGLWSMGAPNATSTFGICIYDILDYRDTNKYKTIRGLDGFDANGSGGVEIISSNWRSTSAITSVKLSPNTGGVTFQQYSSFQLYGVKA